MTKDAMENLRQIADALGVNTSQWGKIQAEGADCFYAAPLYVKTSRLSDAAMDYFHQSGGEKCP
jgi:hypothetical protein